MLKKLVIGFLFLGISKVALADADETGKITNIIVEGNSIVSVWLDGADVSTECTGGGRWTISNTNDSLFKEKVSTLLAAASTGKTVHLHHLAGWGCGAWESNKIYYVHVSY